MLECKYYTASIWWIWYGDLWPPYLTAQVLHSCTSDGITTWVIRRVLSCWVDKRAKINKFFHYRNLLPLDCGLSSLLPRAWTFVFCQFTSSPRDVASVAIVSSTDTMSNTRRYINVFSLTHVILLADELLGIVSQKFLQPGNPSCVPTNNNEALSSQK